MTASYISATIKRIWKQDVCSSLQTTTKQKHYYEINANNLTIWNWNLIKLKYQKNPSSDSDITPSRLRLFRISFHFKFILRTPSNCYSIIVALRYRITKKAIETKPTRLKKSLYKIFLWQVSVRRACNFFFDTSASIYLYNVSSPLESFQV